jgi:mRNA interferase RelE/StbE
VKQVAYSKGAVKALRRMPARDAVRIRDKIAQYVRAPDSLAGNVKALTGSPFLRLRVGDWRVIMDDQGVVLVIVKIARRDAVYTREV